MLYTFKAKITGLICSDFSEPLSQVKVRLYRSRSDQNITALAVASPKDTFAILSDDAIKAKASYLIAEAQTDMDGAVTFLLSEKQKYNGEAFEIDVYCETVPHRKPGTGGDPKPVQFTITTLQPLWRQSGDGKIFIWEYALSSRFWCPIRLRFGAWVIFGKLTLCSTGDALPGLKVRAFDVDWSQDDDLGFAITDSAGIFRIDYNADDFRKTPFTPLINIEWFGGPDLYFRVETPAGTPLLVEPRSRGRQPDRENVGSCFCVKLCIEKKPQDPTDSPYPAFNHVGGYQYITDIDSAPAGTGLTVGDHRAFYSTVRLNGIMAKKFNGNPMEYMFEYAQYDPVTNILGVWKPVTQAQIGRTVIGQVERWAPLFPGDPNPVKTKLYSVNGTAGPGELVTTFTPDGWIKVPQESDFWGPSGTFVPNGNMIGLISQSLASFGSINLTGLKAGNSSTSTGAALATDRHFSLRMWVREQGSAVRVLGGTCQRIAIDNTLYDNMAHHPTWGAWSESGALCVHMLDIKELATVGCKRITDTLNVLYTAAHPNIGSVTVSMTGPGGTYAFTLAGPVGPDTFGTAVPSGFVVADLPPCAYVVHLTVSVLLTTGDSIPYNLYDEMAFCK
jgi:hypothetical protein